MTQAMIDAENHYDDMVIEYYTKTFDAEPTISVGNQTIDEQSELIDEQPKDIITNEDKITSKDILMMVHNIHIRQQREI